MYNEDKKNIICTCNEVNFNKFSYVTIRDLKTIIKKMKQTEGANDGITKPVFQDAIYNP